MKVDLYLTYQDYSDNSFDSNDYYSNEEEYVKAVTEEYNNAKNIVYKSISESKNDSRNAYSQADGKTYVFGSKVSQKQDKVGFSRCSAALSNENGDDETVDGIIERFAQQKPFIEMVELDLDSMEEEFETDFLMWMKECKKINDYSKSLGEEWTWSHIPTKDLMLSFKNKANQDVYAVFEQCKIMDVVDDKTFILFVEKMTLVDKFV